MLLLRFALAFAWTAAGVAAAAAEANDPATTSQVATLTSWLDANKVEVNENAEIAPVPGTGIGVVAKGDIAKGDVIASIPFTALINYEHALVDEVLGPILSAEHLRWVDEPTVVSLFLNFVRFVSCESVSSMAPSGECKARQKYGGYVSSLPKEVGTPLSWSKPELEALLSPLSMIRRQVEDRKELIRGDFERLLQEAPQIKDVIPGLDEQGLIWGLEIVQSRIHGVQIRDNEGEWQHSRCIVPFADSINTADEEDGATNAECFTNEDSTHFLCVASAAVHAGEEVLSHYGGALEGGGRRSLSSSRYLLDYGFVPNPAAMNNEDNDDDNDDNDEPAILHVPELLNIDGTIIIGGSAGLLRALRRRQIVTGESKLEAAKSIVGGIEKALASMKGSEKEDKDELRRQPDTHRSSTNAQRRRRWTAVIRLKERLTLTQVLATARNVVLKEEGVEKEEEGAKDEL